MSDALRVKLRGYTCALRFGYYPNGRLALQLVDAADGTVLCTASVNAMDDTLPPGCIFVKDWSENIGMVDALADAGVIERTPRASASLGRVRANAYQLTAQAALECLASLRKSFEQRREATG